MSKEGYIALHRKIATSDLWEPTRKRTRFEAWVDVLFEARWAASTRYIGGHAVDLVRGEWVASLRYLSKRWHWTVKAVRGFLGMLVRTARIRAQRETQAGTVYLIVNYEHYQSMGTEEGTPKGTGTAEGTGKGTPEGTPLSVTTPSDAFTSPLQGAGKGTPEGIAKGIAKGTKENKETKQEASSSSSGTASEFVAPAAAPRPVLVVDYLTRCVVAMNRGLAKNPHLHGYHEIATTTQAARTSWEADKIPIAIAERAIYERAMAYQPTPHRRQPTSLRYFDQPVREAWDLERQHAAAAALPAVPSADPMPTFEPTDVRMARLTRERAEAIAAKKQAARAAEGVA